MLGNSVYGINHCLDLWGSGKECVFEKISKGQRLGLVEMQWDSHRKVSPERLKTSVPDSMPGSTEKHFTRVTILLPDVKEQFFLTVEIW